MLKWVFLYSMALVFVVGTCSAYVYENWPSDVTIEQRLFPQASALPSWIETTQNFYEQGKIDEQTWFNAISWLEENNIITWGESQSILNVAQHEKSIMIIEPQDQCLIDYEPVCGTNGKTYTNKCQLQENNVELKHKGACVQAFSERALITFGSTTTSTPEPRKMVIPATYDLFGSVTVRDNIECGPIEDIDHTDATSGYIQLHKQGSVGISSCQTIVMNFDTSDVDFTPTKATLNYEVSNVFNPIPCKDLDCLTTGKKSSNINLSNEYSVPFIFENMIKDDKTHVVDLQLTATLTLEN